jgi:hypothetical protein
MVQMSPYAGTNTSYGTLDANVQMKDNIFATYPGGVAPAAFVLTGPCSGFTSDYNLFNMPNVAGGAFLKLGGTAYTLGDSWTKKTGCDTKSLSADPGFVGGNISEIDHMVPGTPADQNACVAEATQYIATFQLAAGSPAIDTGVDLGVLNDDFLRRPRPADGDGDGKAQTDIGAFERQPAK